MYLLIIHLLADSIEPIQSNEKTRVLPNGTLIINAVTPEDAGWYSCIAQNKGMSISTDVIFVILCYNNNEKMKIVTSYIMLI